MECAARWVDWYALPSFQHMSAADDPCPGEYVINPPVPCSVGGAELLVRFVRGEEDLLPSGDGGMQLHSLSFSADDIKGRLQAGARRSVSSFRWEMISSGDLFKRADNVNLKPEWKSHPTVALAVAREIREIRDSSARRDFCVFADESGANDPLGNSPFHCSIRKSNPPPYENQRTQMQIMRAQLAEAFNAVLHLFEASQEATINPTR